MSFVFWMSLYKIGWLWPNVSKNTNIFFILGVHFLFMIFQHDITKFSILDEVRHNSFTHWLNLVRCVWLSNFYKRVTNKHHTLLLEPCFIGLFKPFEKNRYLKIMASLDLKKEKNFNILNDIVYIMFSFFLLYDVFNFLNLKTNTFK